MQQKITGKPKQPFHPQKVMDDFDRAILRIVQHDNKTPQREIASAVNLSAAAVQRRLAAMEDAGVISRNVAVVDPVSFGLGVTAIVEVQLRDERTVTVEAAKLHFGRSAEVQQCYFSTGGVSFVLVIVTSNMRSYEELASRLFGENEDVLSYRTLVALDRVKFDTAIVIPPASSAR